jgi:hypothetical protein
MINTGDRNSDALRQMTTEALLYLGMRQAVYLKAGTFYNAPYFMLHDADGVALELFDSIESAVAAVSAQRLDFVAVH